MRFRRLFPLLLILSTVVVSGRTAEVAPFSILGGPSGLQTAFSYFDNEGNSPFRGDARSQLSRTDDGVRIWFDLAAVDGAFCGWYAAVQGNTVNLADKNVLRFELRGSPDIPTDRFFIGFRTANIQAKDNGARVTLAELGFKRFPASFVTVEIPMARFLEREPGLDLTRASNPLVVSIVEPAQDVRNAEVWIRNARWTRDGKKRNNAVVARY